MRTSFGVELEFTMSAWKRFGWGVVVLGEIFLATSASAAPLSSSGAWNWTVWVPGKGMVSIKGTTLDATGTERSWSSLSSVVSPSDPRAGAPRADSPPVFTVSAPPVSAAIRIEPPPSPAPSATQSETPGIAHAQTIPSSHSPAPDAFINFGNGPNAQAADLTTGPIQPWFSSPSVTQVFGGTPNPQQQADFTGSVLKDIEKTFQLNGINLNLTQDPNAHAAHTLSVVSGATYPQNSNAIGITDVGGNGFGFIDKLGYAKSVDQLEWAVAHNVSHELMHAFGVAVHHDQSGSYLDSATANWSMLTDPNSKFGPEATQEMTRELAQAHSSSSLRASAELLSVRGHGAHCPCPNCRRGSALQLAPAPVPEPAALAVWSMGFAVVLLLRFRAWKTCVG
ncbi:MAG: hypothetical protein NVSMB9_25670 [Isosphaeraceae bacterium]